MPRCWKKVKSTLRPAKSDSGFFHRFRPNSLSQKKSDTRPHKSLDYIGPSESDRNEFEDDTPGYESLHSYQARTQYGSSFQEPEPSTSTAHLAQVYSTDDNISKRENNSSNEVIYAKPHKKKTTVPIKIVPKDSSDSDEIIDISQMDHTDYPEILSSEEKKRNLNSLVTLSSILKDIYNKSPPETSVTSDVKENEVNNYYENGCTIQYETVQIQAEVTEQHKHQNATENSDVQRFDSKNEDIRNLENIIFRLVDELKKYQPDLPNLLITSHDTNKITSPISSKVLSPLFATYDDRIRQKDQLIQNYEVKLLELQKQLLSERAKTHQSLTSSEDKLAELNKWKVKQEENNLTIQIYESKELEYQEKIRRLSQETILLQRQNNELTSKLTDCKLENSKLKDKYEHVTRQLKETISREKHLKIIDKLKENLNERKKQVASEVTRMTQDFHKVKEELAKYAADIIDLRAEKCQLEGQNAALVKMLRFTERKSVLYEQQCEKTVEEFAVSQQQLDTFGLVVEELSAERDAYMKMVEEQQAKTSYLKNRIAEDNVTKNKLEKKLKKYKLKVKKGNHQPVTSNRMLKKHQEYENEILRLRTLLDQETEKLNAVQSDKRNLEQDLELVWRISSSENQRITNVTNIP